MNPSTRRPLRTSPRRHHALIAGVLAGALVALAPGQEAQAGPREDMRSAYGEALRLFNELEVDRAAQAIEQGIAAAEAAGAGDDPTLASLYLMKAALLYSTEGEAGASKITEALTKAVKLNYYVVMPVEVRSEGLTNYLEQAKKYAGAAPSSSIVHEVPPGACGEDIGMEALLGVPDGGQAALYVRRAGATEYQGLSMDVFSNVATGTVNAAVHGDENLEYFIVAFDAQQRAVASFGTKDQPIKLSQGCAPDPVVPAVVENSDEDPETPDKVDRPRPASSGETTLPRVWINLGLGTGFGLARGTAERTYEQYFPSEDGFQYNAPQYACALARWYAGGVGNSLPSAAEFAGQVVPTYGPTTLQGQPLSQQVIDNYDRGRCGAFHPVSSGFASAPFHIEPEVQFRVSKRITLGVYSRLQVVTGSNVVRDDPEKDLGDPSSCPEGGNGSEGNSWCEEVFTGEPRGNFQDKAPFSWTVGAKFRYYFLADDAKFRLFAGGFAGYGFSRLRVPMGFANDRNGNSVPDDFEGLNGRDASGSDVSTCFPVFPYRDACASAGGPANADNMVAESYRGNARSDERVDTVRMGPGHVGALFGFNYQVVKNFGLFGEIQVGAWFPDTSSMLFDINVGPAVTF